MKYWIFLFCFGFSSLSMAQSRTLKFEATSDSFTLIMNGGRGTIDGKEAELSSLSQLLPALIQTPTDTCPSLPLTADLKITEGAVIREVYLSQRVISDKKNCLRLDGDGLYHFPLHRDFLVGPKTEKITINSPIEVYKQGQKLFAIKKVDQKWLSESSEQLLNYDFVERFMNSISEFRIRTRLNDQVTKEKPQLSVRIAGKALEFFKIADATWALKKPGRDYLLLSDDWRFWQDFDESVFQDRYASEIKLLRSPGASSTEKIEILGKIEATWSPNLRRLYEWQLLNDPDNQIKTLALGRLKRKPSIQSIPAIIELLEKTDDEDLKRDAVAVLRIQNPKGPAYKLKLSDEERRKIIEFWRAWWKQQQKPK